MYGIPNISNVKSLVTKEVGPQTGPMRRTEFQFIGFPLALQDNPAVAGYANVQLYTFPQGLLFLKGGVVNLSVGKSSAGIVNTFRTAFGVGPLVGRTDALGDDAVLRSPDPDRSGTWFRRQRPLSRTGGPRDPGGVQSRVG